MSLASGLNIYLNLNVLLVVAFVALKGFAWICRQLKIQAKTELQIHYAILAAIFVLAATQPLLPKQEIFQPVAKVWAAPSMQAFSTQQNRSGFISAPAFTKASVDADPLTILSIVFFAGLFTVGLGTLGRDGLILLRLRRNSYLLRRLGDVRIFANDHIDVPFSYAIWNTANVMIPSSMISKHQDYRMAVAHELQHHRQKDTQWVYVIAGLRLFCVVNPVIHMWHHWISELQEFACDETLVDQQKVESRAYARCLVEVAQTAIQQKHGPVRATGLRFLVNRTILKRRIEKMFTQTIAKPGRSISIAFGVLIACLMSATSFAAKDIVQDRRVTMEQAQALAKAAGAKSDFPIVVNDLVLKQLNRFIGTPEGRDYMRNALQRMENYRSTVEEKISDYNMPTELMAIPLIESAYQDLPESNKVGWGAGVWMFIQQTARNYGLRVDAANDDRLNVELETDAAMRYLQSNHLRFNDWLLSILAYNVGENSLQQAIDKGGTKDAWTLLRQGLKTDRDYLPRVMAAIIIMKNPDSVR